MRLHEHLPNEFPDMIFCHYEATLREIFQCVDFRLTYFETNTDLTIDYFGTSHPGKGKGSVIIQSVVSYCRVTHKQLFITTPRPGSERFWRRNVFQKTWDADSRWVHKPL